MHRFARIIMSSLLIVTAGLALLVLLGTSFGVRNTVEHSRLIDISFKNAASYVDAYIHSHDQLPSSTTFKTWTDSQPDSVYGIKGVELQLPLNSSIDIDGHGAPPKNGYVLIYWRGEWEETYVSWTQKSTLELNESAYFLFNSRLWHIVFVLFVSVSSLIAAIRVWPRKQPAV